MRLIFSRFIGRFTRSKPATEINYNIAAPFRVFSKTREKYDTIINFIDSSIDSKLASRIVIKARKQGGPDFVIDLGNPAGLFVDSGGLFIHARASDFRVEEHLTFTEVGLVDKNGYMVGGEMIKLKGGPAHLAASDTLKSTQFSVGVS